MTRRFLLGELAEEERSRVEDLFLEDGEAFEVMLAAEEELVDAYARGELRGRERERFEQHFLSTPRGREQVLRARSLIEALARAEPAAADTAPTRWQSFLEGLRALSAPLRYGLAAVLLVFLLGGVWLLSRRGEEPRQARGGPEAVRPEAPREPEVASRPEQGRPGETPPAGGGASAGLEEKPAGAPPPSKRSHAPRQRPAAVASLILAPGLTRGAGASARTLLVPPGAERARLTLELEQGGYASYRAALVTAAGRKVWGSDRLRKTSSGDALILTLPTALLAEGDYVLELSGAAPSGDFESVADYSFRVLRK